MRFLQRTDVDVIHLTAAFVQNIPDYAILSHTWGPEAEEVNIRDILDGTGTDKRGYRKLLFCTAKAKLDGLKFSWVDTCCIDKSSSSELQESITSMFNWYQNAKRCYVYLADVSTASDWELAFRQSRWFTRGWTLQELVAPESVEFYSKEGVRLGDRASLERQIHEATGIPFDVLRGDRSLFSFSVKERMDWAKNRNTTRNEDKAYSLLGLFNVSMPLLYGEGEMNAFRRLHEEIEKASVGGMSYYLEAKKRDEILFWLQGLDPNQKHQHIQALRVAGTGQWVLSSSEYLRWRDNHSASNIFWCHGIQGSGKTFLTSTIIDDLRSFTAKIGCPLAFFYFNHQDQSAQTPNAVFLSVLRQLVATRTRLPKTVVNVYDQRGTNPPTPLKPSEVLKLLVDSLQELGTAFIIMDALDECDDPKNLKGILKFVDLVKVPQTRVMITSRPFHQAIKHICTSSVELVIEADRTDLRTYVLHEIEESDMKDVIDEPLVERIMKRLLNGAHGMFLLPALQLRSILNKPTRGDIEESLEGISNNLDGAYNETISRIPDDRKRLALESLMWVCYAQRVLTFAELQEALSVRSGHKVLDRRYSAALDITLNSCRGLIDIEPDTRHIRFAHHTVREFLVKNSATLFPAAHAAMAVLCMKYLMLEDFREGPFPDTESVDTCTQKFSFLEYAATFWGDHSRESATNTSVRRYLDRFFNHRIALAWANQIMNFARGRRDVYWSTQECMSITPLHAAARFGLCAAMKDQLRSAPSQVNAKTSIGITPLLRASYNGHLDAVKILLAYGADPYLQNCFGNALHCAAEAGQVDIIQELVSNGMDPNVRTDTGRTVLCCSLDSDRADSFEALVALGADITFPCHHESAQPLLHEAVIDNCERIIGLLVERKWADIDCRNVLGETALHLAAGLKNRTTIAIQLLNAGADTKLRDNLGWTPLQVAQMAFNEDVIQVLQVWGS